jgi:dTDP-4-dehydrorhamnose reductase
MSKVKVLLLGQSGMLGYALHKLLHNSEGIDLISTARDDIKSSIMFDVNKNSVYELLKDIRPRYVINCLGYNFDNKTDNVLKIVKAININSIFPRFLANSASKLGIRLLQINTDGVFSGKSGNYYENSTRDARDVYGISKILGEVNNQLSLSLRCSIVGEQYNTSKQKYLAEWFKSQPFDGTIKGYKNFNWNGITTNSFSRIILGLVQNNSEITGSYHLIPRDTLTKYELLNLFKYRFDRSDINLVEAFLPKPIDRSLNTIHPQINDYLWKLGGYNSVPEISQLITSM